MEILGELSSFIWNPTRTMTGFLNNMPIPNRKSEENYRVPNPYEVNPCIYIPSGEARNEMTLVHSALPRTK